MRALVTGSSGFIGRNFVRELDSRGYELVGFDIVDGEDVFTRLEAERSIFDLVVHAAAQSPHRAAIDEQPSTHIYNLKLDSSLFWWAVRTGQRRVLYLSSCAVLDERPDAYGLLKLTGERMAEQARAAGIAVTVVRPYSGYGEDQDERFPFGAFAARARRREDPFVIWGDGTQVRDWIHVDDLVAGALALVEAGVRQPVSLCTGVGTSMRDLVESMCKTAGYSPTIKLLADAPPGVASRVGDPVLLHNWYVPRVTLYEGVARALS